VAVTDHANNPEKISSPESFDKLISKPLDLKKLE